MQDFEIKHFKYKTGFIIDALYLNNKTTSNLTAS